MQGDFGGSAGGMKLSICAGNEGIEELATLFEPNPTRCRDVRLHLMGVGARGVAKLQRGESVAVACNVDRGRVAVESLPNHEHGLAMVVALVADEGDVGRDG